MKATRWDTEKKRMLFLAILIAAGCVFALSFLIKTGNTNQIYKEITVEWTARHSSNKSAEKALNYLLAFGGLAVYFAYYLFTQRPSLDRELNPPPI